MPSNDAQITTAANVTITSSTTTQEPETTTAKSTTMQACFVLFATILFL